MGSRYIIKYVVVCVVEFCSLLLLYGSVHL